MSTGSLRKEKRVNRSSPRVDNELTRETESLCRAGLRVHRHEFKALSDTSHTQLLLGAGLASERGGFYQSWSFANKFKEGRDEQRSQVAGKKIHERQAMKSQLGTEGRDSNGKEEDEWKVQDGPNSSWSWPIEGSGLGQEETVVRK